MIERVLARIERRPVLLPLVKAVPVGALLASILVVMGLWDWGHVRGWPVERATITASVLTGRSESCGKGARADVMLQTWVSSNPPRGLPKQFTHEEGCSAGSVGDREDVVRVVRPDGSVKVWIDPATSLVFVAELGLFGFAGGWLLGAVIFAIGQTCSALRRRFWPAKVVQRPDRELAQVSDCGPVIREFVQSLDGRLTPSERSECAELLTSAGPQAALERMLAAFIDRDERLSKDEAALLGSVTRRLDLRGRAARDAAFLVSRL